MRHNKLRFRRKAVTVAAVLVGLAIVAAAILAVWQLSAVRETQRNAMISQELLSDLSNQIAEDGLAELPELGAENTDKSRIQASFIVAQMAEPRLGDLQNQLSKDRIYEYATSESNPTATRLLAFGTLHYLGDSRSEEGRALAQQEMNSQPDLIGPETLAEYLAVAEAAYVIDQKLPLRELAEFTPGEDEQLQRLAVSALGLRHLFSNSNSVQNFFPDLHPKLVTWANGDYEHIPQFLLSNIALNGTPDSPDNRQQIAREKQGCKSSKTFFSVDGTPSGECSLINTHFAWMMGAVR